jgi:hypothetical protein
LVKISKNFLIIAIASVPLRSTEAIAMIAPNPVYTITFMLPKVGVKTQKVGVKAQKVGAKTQKVGVKTQKVGVKTQKVGVKN